MDMEFDVLPDGTIRFSRNDPHVNEQMLEILSLVAPDYMDELKEFLDGALLVEQIIGDEHLCG